MTEVKTADVNLVNSNLFLKDVELKIDSESAVLEEANIIEPLLSAKSVTNGNCFLCQKFAPEINTCADCGLIRYCCLEHLTIHRPETFCFPFKIQNDPRKGKIMVATRSIQPLEMILYDQTKAIGPRPGYGDVCLNCLKSLVENEETNHYRCSKCFWKVCNLKCEMGTTHQRECSILQNARRSIESNENASDFYRAIGPMRLLMLRTLDPQHYERFLHLMDNNENRMKDTEMWETYKRDVNMFLRQSCHQVQWTDEDCNRACGIFWTNAFGCCSGRGQAVFPTFSFISHSCVPNSRHFIFPKRRHLVLQAKTVIEKGQEISICYISPLQGILRRRIKLRDKWFFDCECIRCKDATELGSYTSAWRCNVCGDVAIPVRPLSYETLWKCQDCGTEILAQQIIQTENRLANQLAKSDHQDVVVLQDMLIKFEQTFHSNHYLSILLKRQLISITDSDTKRLKELSVEKLMRRKYTCQQILDVLAIIDPGPTHDRGVMLGFLASTGKFLAQIQLRQGIIRTEREFLEAVKLCVEQFSESQDLNFRWLLNPDFHDPLKNTTQDE